MLLEYCVQNEKSSWPEQPVQVDSPKKARLKASNTLTIMELLLSNAELPLRFELATYSEVGAIRVRIAQRIAQQITINIHRSQGNACADTATATATATAYWMSCSRFDAVTTGTFFGYEHTRGGDAALIHLKGRLSYTSKAGSHTP
eukprot:1656643-Pleurochrysis_carterae.AAC.1